MNPRKRPVTIGLLLASLWLIPAEGLGGVTGKAVPTSIESKRGNSVLLSLRISKATKKGEGVSRYKSVARQRKGRPTAGPSPSTGR